MKKGDLIIYQSPEGNTKVEALLHEETVWLTQKQIADLFQTTPQNITHIYQEHELSEEPTCKDFLQVQKEGNRRVDQLAR
jgi:hypothetical protein